MYKRYIMLNECRCKFNNVLRMKKQHDACVLYAYTVLPVFLFFPGRESKKNGVVLNKYLILVFRRILYTLYSLSMSPVVFSLKLLYNISY